MEFLFGPVQVKTSRGLCDAPLRIFWLEMHMAMLASSLHHSLPTLVELWNSVAEDDGVVIFSLRRILSTLDGSMPLLSGSV